MKKYLLLLFIVVLAFFVTACNDIVPKTDYLINEEALIDDIRIKLTNAEYLSNDILEVTFKITNERKNSITLSPDNNFKLYDINQVQIPNLYTTNENVIKKNETITYTLQYNSKKDIYDIIFYSGIATNNIKFTITSLDIE